MASETRDPRQKRKRIPVTLAGSYLTRGVNELPQAPPKPRKQPKLKLPLCPHEFPLTEPEFRSQADENGQPRFFINDANAFKAEACPECYPFCEHGEDLTATEILQARRTGQKRCSECPACTGSRNKKAWNKFLREGGFSEYRGNAPATANLPTVLGGQRPIRSGKQYCTGGGAKEMEDTDAASRVGVDIPLPSSACITFDGDERGDEPRQDILDDGERPQETEMPEKSDTLDLIDPTVKFPHWRSPNSPEYKKWLEGLPPHLQDVMREDLRNRGFEV